VLSLILFDKQMGYFVFFSKEAAMIETGRRILLSALGLFLCLLFLFIPEARAVHIVKSANKKIQIVYTPGLRTTQPIIMGAYIAPDLDEEITSTESVSFEWSGNYFNAKTYKWDQNLTWRLDVTVNDTNNNIQRGYTSWPVAALGFWPTPICQVTANWTQLPITERFTVRIKGRFKTLNIEGAFDEKATIEVEILPRPRTAPGLPTAGNSWPFEWRPSNNLVWLTAPTDTWEKVVATNAIQSGYRAVETGTGPVVIYQTTGGAIHYKMLGSISGTILASGDLCQGQDLIKVNFDPDQYGTRATLTTRKGNQTIYTVYKIDMWGDKGTSGIVGRALATTLPHWLVQWRSLIFLFEYDQTNAGGRLTCKENYTGWQTTVATGVDGLIVPAATGGGPVVVYESNNIIRTALIKWDKGTKIREIGLGSGSLLNVIYTKRGAYGARGTATILSTYSKDVSFCIDLWGDVGCNTIVDTVPLTLDPATPLPPPGFPNTPGSSTGGGPETSPDTDGDGFSDGYEQYSGTNPNDPASKPNIELSIVLLIDKSGSMDNNNKMEDAKKAAIDALSRINTTSEIGIIAFSGECDETFPIIADFTQDKNYLNQQIQTIQAGGGTPMTPALLQARQFIWNKAHGQRSLIILLCDGANNCPPDPSEAAGKIFQRIISSLNLHETEFFGLPTFQFVGVGFPSFLDMSARTETGQNPQVPQEQAGPDRAPSGVQSADTIPLNLEPPAPGSGGPNSVPSGVQPPQNVAPVEYVPPYGEMGVATSRPVTSAGTPNQQIPIQISTVGFGLQNEPAAAQALRNVAAAGGGQAYSAQNLGQLTTAFNQAITQTPGIGGGGGGGPRVTGGPMGIPGWLMIALVAMGLGIVAIAIGITILHRRGTGAAPQAAVAHLEAYFEDGSVVNFPVGSGLTTIGSDARNKVTLKDTMVSRRHAELTVSDQGYYLRDLGSSNGTFVNGKAVTEAYLYLNDEVRIGSTRIFLRA
jgi:hypothetical protein